MRKKKGVSRLIVTLLLLAGCLITIWPVGETLLHDRTLTGKALTYEREQRVSGAASAGLRPRSATTRTWIRGSSRTRGASPVT